MQQILSHRKSWKQSWHRLGCEILEDSDGSRNVTIAEMDE